VDQNPKLRAVALALDEAVDRTLALINAPAAPQPHLIALQKLLVRARLDAFDARQAQLDLVLRVHELEIAARRRHTSGEVSAGNLQIERVTFETAP